MISEKLIDINKKLNPQNNRIKYVFIKFMLLVMARKKMLDYSQYVTYNKEEVETVWSIIESFCDNFFDLNYNRKSDFESFSEKIINSLFFNQNLYFITLFCPGYSKNGYKSEVGFTTKWKLLELYKIKMYLEQKNISSKFLICYSDVFLENCDKIKCENWENELIINKKNFKNEARLYFEFDDIISASELKIFNHKDCVGGYIDEVELNNIKPTTYNMFIKYNKKFYDKLGFSTAEQIERNKKLMTMYRIFSNYINSQKNSVFLPMENMYERENIFSENNTCTMYLNQRNGEKYGR